MSAEQLEVQDFFDAIELYYERGWTDGLPVVPPTEQRVRALLDAAGLASDHVLGEVPERDRVITAEHLAINAAMAGCLPAYMPVLVAAVSLYPGFSEALDLLKQRHRIREVVFLEKPFLGNIAPEAILAEIAGRADGAITGVGD